MKQNNEDINGIMSQLGQYVLREFEHIDQHQRWQDETIKLVHANSKSIGELVIQMKHLTERSEKDSELIQDGLKKTSELCLQVARAESATKADRQSMLMFKFIFSLGASAIVTASVFVIRALIGLSEKVHALSG